MAIGWIDDPDISELRMLGGEVCYPWRDRDERFDAEWLLLEGLLGRSKSNVYAIAIPNHLDTETKRRVAAKFPDIQLVALIPWDAADCMPGSVQRSCRHYADEVSRNSEKPPVIIRLRDGPGAWQLPDRMKTQL